MKLSRVVYCCGFRADWYGRGEPFKEPCEIPADIQLKALKSESREKWKFGDQVRHHRALFF
jgi:hypothetical protein